MASRTSQKVKLNDPLDVMFENTDPDKQNKDGVVYRLPISKLIPFRQHPFKPYTEEKLAEMADSIKERGVVSPIIVRKLDDEHYEIIAGHNRVAASKLAELTDIPAIIREMDDDTATLLMIESNLNQRENILLSERGQAYKLQMEVIKRQGERTDLTYVHREHKLARDTIAEKNGVSGISVSRYIRLTFLISDLSDMVDNGKLKFTYGVDLSYLIPEHQQTVYELLQEKGYKLTADNVSKLKELSKSEELTDEQIEEVIAIAKPKPKSPSVHKRVDKLVKRHKLPPNKAADIVERAIEMYVQSEEYKEEYDMIK
jgi:ParB-like partition proteins